MQHEKQFLDTIAPFAVDDMKRSGVLASLTLAQAILESNWGRSGLATKGKNLFGIKGKGGEYTTTEYVNGKAVQVVAGFRHYDTWAGSIQDHSDLLLRLTRYKAVIGEKDYKTACRAIQAAGYATDPKYAEKLIGVIETYNLDKFDKSEPTIQKTIGVKVNGKNVGTGFLIGGVSYIPARVVVEQLGASITYDGKTVEVTK